MMDQRAGLNQWTGWDRLGVCREEVSGRESLRCRGSKASCPAKGNRLQRWRRSNRTRTKKSAFLLSPMRKRGISSVPRLRVGLRQAFCRGRQSCDLSTQLRDRSEERRVGKEC